MPMAFPDKGDVTHIYFRASGPEFFLILSDCPKMDGAHTVMLYSRMPSNGQHGLTYLVRQRWPQAHEVIESTIRHAGEDTKFSWWMNWFANPVDFVDYHLTFRCLPGNKV